MGYLPISCTLCQSAHQYIRSQGTLWQFGRQFEWKGHHPFSWHLLYGRRLFFYGPFCGHIQMHIDKYSRMRWWIWSWDSTPHQAQLDAQDQNTHLRCFISWWLNRHYHREFWYQWCFCMVAHWHRVSVSFSGWHWGNGNLCRSVSQMVLLTHNEVTALFL